MNFILFQIGVYGSEKGLDAVLESVLVYLGGLWTVLKASLEWLGCVLERLECCLERL